MKTLEELLHPTENGMDLVREWLAQATRPVEILECQPQKADAELLGIQVTTRSPMGAIVHESAGLLIHHGFLRILGSGGHPRLDRGLYQWNLGKTLDSSPKPPPYLLIADDVIGGFFALNGGGLSPSSLGKIFYFAPDTLEWEDTGLGYSDFLYFAFCGDLEGFYKGRFWPGWEAEVSLLSGEQAYSFVPFLWTKEGQTDIAQNERKAIDIEEIWAFQQQMASQLNGTPQ